MLRVLPLSILLLLAIGLVRGRPTTGGALSGPDYAAPAAAAELLVGLRPQAYALTDAMIESRLGGRLIGRLPALGVVRLSLPADEPLPAAVARLQALPWVEYAEPNLLLRATAVPNDPFFSGQGAYLDQVQAPSAWDVEEGQDAVLVAVLDSGIELGHEDLVGKVWSNPFEVPDNGVDDDNNGCVDDVHGCGFVTPQSADPACRQAAAGSINDDNGHGTFVSGIIAARGHNGIGVIGAAPGVTILPVKILDCLGGGTAADAAQGILYAARAGARVANVSFGADGESITLGNAIRQASEKYGMIVVAASGNEGSGRVTFPARLPQVIAVGSSGIPTDQNARSPFSDWGPEVAVAAPGLNIISTVPKQFCATAWLCVQGDQPYALASGTSFAAPLVSALAALIVSRTPNLSPDAVRHLIQATAEPLPDGATPNWDGAGRIRMRFALDVRRFYLGAAGLSRQ